MRFRISLKFTLVVVLLSAVTLAFLTNGPLRQKQACQKIRDAGGSVVYSYQRPGGVVPTETIHEPGPAWLRNLIGIDFFTTPFHVGFRFDEIENRLQPLEDLRSLRSLHITECDLPADELAHLHNNIELRKLDLYDTTLNDDGLRHLECLTKLEELSINDTEISDAGLISLSKLKSLRVLWLGNNQITDDGLQHLANLKNLEKLFLYRTKINGSGLKHLAELPNLQFLRLDSNELVSISGLGGSTSLQYFDISHAAIDSIQPIVGIPTLTKLHIHNTDVELKIAQEMLPNVKIHE